MENEKPASVEDKAEAIFGAGILDDDEVVEQNEIEEFDDKGLVEDDEEPEETDDEDLEEPEEPEENAQVEGDDVVQVEFEGTLYEVPVQLKDALLRQADYTQKTQEVSAKVKEVDVVRGTLQLEEQQYKFAQQIQPDLIKAQQLEDNAIQTQQYLKDNVDNLTAIDIEKLRIAVDESRTERDKIVNALQGKQQEFQQAQQQSHQELLKQGTEVLRQRIKNWDEAAQKQVREHILSKGYSQVEMDNVVDPRMVEIAWEASQYRALVDGKAAAVKKVVGTPSIKEKARNPMPQEVKDKLNLRKTLKNPKLNSKQKARAIQKTMGDRFG